jgi:PPM family protein phosphatase
MEIVTALVPDRGTPDTRHDAMIATRSGLMAVAHSLDPSADETAACRMALGALRAHVERHEDLLDRFRRTPVSELRERVLTLVEEAVGHAARETYAFGRRRGELFVSLDVVLLVPPEAFVAHVGSGRVYMVRRGLVHQLTVDHTRSQGSLAPMDEDTESGPRQPTRALGPHPTVRVEALCMELSPEDRFILCNSELALRSSDTNVQDTFVASHLDDLPARLLAQLPLSKPIAIAAQLGSGEPFTPTSASSRLAILKPMPLFAHLNEPELRLVARATTPRQFEAGHVIFEQGAPGVELYLVISGTVEILRNDRRIAVLGPSSNFGEMAMLDTPARSASARCVETSELLVISRQAFFELLRGNPLLAVKILWNLTLRLSANLRVTSQRVAELEGMLGNRA